MTNHDPYLSLVTIIIFLGTKLAAFSHKFYSDDY